jgi:hypothetical protein
MKSFVGWGIVCETASSFCVCFEKKKRKNYYLDKISDKKKHEFKEGSNY